MAEQQQQRPKEGPGSTRVPLTKKGTSAPQIIAVLTLLPIGGILLTLSGLTFAGAAIGLVVTTPLFLLFSPVLVPTIITIALSLAGFLASGAFGLVGLSSLSRIANYLCRARPVESVKHQMLNAAGQMGQRMKDVEEAIQSKAGRT
ncbi:hypothetical protein ACLOJK_032601 [Asimina triloba]